MKIISLISQKGGTGKTTTATGLAVAAQLAGFSATIIDLDPQTNAMNWADRRAELDPAPTGPEVLDTSPSRLARVIEDAAKEPDSAPDFVFIDTPGKLESAGLEAAKVSDLVLMPVQLSMMDVETLKPVRDILAFAGHPPAGILLNGVHPSKKTPGDDIREIAAQLGLPIVPVHLAHLNEYKDATNMGQGPQERDPEGRAAQDIAALFRYVLDTVNQLAPRAERKAANG